MSERTQYTRTCSEHVHTCIWLQLCNLSRSFPVCTSYNHALFSSDQKRYIFVMACIYNSWSWVGFNSAQSMYSADGIRVSFETQFNADTQTKYLAVCGSLDVLGNWKVERAVIAGNRNYVVLITAYKTYPRSPRLSLTCLYKVVKDYDVFMCIV